MKNFIQELEKRNNAEKRQWIKKFLTDRNIPYSSQPFRTFFARGENIIVDFPPGRRSEEEKRVLLTAHYNAWFSSPGANDNASGVSVLLGFIERLIKEPKQTSIRIAFFDLEDGWAFRAGSKYYVKTVGVQRIDRMYNLEGVGMGQNVLFWPGGPWLQSLVLSAQSVGFKQVIQLPDTNIIFTKYPIPIRITSDHVPFIQNGLAKAVCITAIPDEDVRFAESFINGETQWRLIMQAVKYALLRRGDIPKILRHYHNADDRSEFIEEESLRKVLEFLWKEV